METETMTQLVIESISDQARVPATGAGWRNVIGELAEQEAALALGAKRLHTGSANGKKYCPDLRRGGVDYEVKSVGTSGAVLIYSVRLAKDRWYASNNALCYVLVVHKVTCPQPSMYEARMLMKWARIYVIPFCYVDAICVGIAPRILNKKYKPANGWCQRGYELGGYSIRAKLLIEAFPHGRIQ